MINELIKIMWIKRQIYDYLAYMLKEKTLKSINKWTFEISFILRHSKAHSFFWVKFFYFFYLCYSFLKHIIYQIPITYSQKNSQTKMYLYKVTNKILIHNFQLQNSIIIYLKNICCNFNKCFFLFKLRILIQ